MKTEVKIRSLFLGVSLLAGGFATAQTTKTTEQAQTSAQTQETTNPEIEALKMNGV